MRHRFGLTARVDGLGLTAGRLLAGQGHTVAFVLSALGQDALFLGDLPSTVEDTLAVPDVDVLMVAHHGSRFSTSDRLLGAAKPEQAVLSYGRNTYGHPNGDVLSRLEAHGARVFHTREQGAVWVRLE